MTKTDLIAALRHCVNAYDYDACERCPYRGDPSYVSESCSDDLMSMAADYLELLTPADE